MGTDKGSESVNVEASTMYSGLEFYFEQDTQ